MYPVPSPAVPTQPTAQAYLLQKQLAGLGLLPRPFGAHPLAGEVVVPGCDVAPFAEVVVVG